MLHKICVIFKEILFEFLNIKMGFVSIQAFWCFAIIAGRYLNIVCAVNCDTRFITYYHNCVLLHSVINISSTMLQNVYCVIWSYYTSLKPKIEETFGIDFCQYNYWLIHMSLSVNIRLVIVDMLRYKKILFYSWVLFPLFMLIPTKPIMYGYNICNNSFKYFLFLLINNKDFASTNKIISIVLYSKSHYCIWNAAKK